MNVFTQSQILRYHLTVGTVLGIGNKGMIKFVFYFQRDWGLKEGLKL